MVSESGNGRARHPRRRGIARRRALFALLLDLQRRDRAPTLAELAAAIGVAETTIRYHLRWLEEDGVIEIGPPRLNIRILREDGDG